MTLFTKVINNNQQLILKEWKNSQHQFESITKEQNVDIPTLTAVIHSMSTVQCSL